MGIPTGTLAQERMLETLAVKPWPKTLCNLCKNRPATGVFLCVFTSSITPLPLCADCAFYNASHVWTGHFGRKLKRIMLICSTAVYERSN